MGSVGLAAFEAQDAEKEAVEDGLTAEGEQGNRGDDDAEGLRGIERAKRLVCPGTEGVE